MWKLPLRRQVAGQRPALLNLPILRHFMTRFLLPLRRQFQSPKTLTIVEQLQLPLERRCPKLRPHEGLHPKPPTIHPRYQQPDQDPLTRPTTLQGSELMLLQKKPVVRHSQLLVPLLIQERFSICSRSTTIQLTSSIRVREGTFSLSSPIPLWWSSIPDCSVPSRAQLPIIQTTWWLLL